MSCWNDSCHPAGNAPTPVSSNARWPTGTSNTPTTATHPDHPQQQSHSSRPPNPPADARGTPKSPVLPLKSVLSWQGCLVTGVMSAAWGRPCRRVRIHLWSVMCVDGRCGSGRCHRRRGKRRSGPVPGAMPPPMWAASGLRSRDRRTCPWRCAGRGPSRTAFPLVSPMPSASSTGHCAGSGKLACRRPIAGGCQNERMPVVPAGK